MPTQRRRPGLQLLTAAAVMGLALPALAHHGWAWAEEEQSQLTGSVKSVSMGAPHPTLMIAAADGATWRVELSNPAQTARAGFTGTSVKPGDAVTILGNRDRDRSQMHMKAVRVTAGGRNYDLYPDRIRSN